MILPVTHFKNGAFLLEQQQCSSHIKGSFWYLRLLCQWGCNTIFSNIKSKVKILNDSPKAESIEVSRIYLTNYDKTNNNNYVTVQIKFNMFV